MKVAPDERFVVGDGTNFDRYSLSPELAERKRKLGPDAYCPMWDCDRWMTNGGQTIWLYELPEKSLYDEEKYANRSKALKEDIKKYPEQAVRTRPLARFRSLFHTVMFPYRVESNADVTPDSRWAVFQSSSEEDLFQVWAAKVPQSDAR